MQFCTIKISTTSEVTSFAMIDTQTDQTILVAMVDSSLNGPFVFITGGKRLQVPFWEVQRDIRAGGIEIARRSGSIVGYMQSDFLGLNFVTHDFHRRLVCSIE